jgi:hypothetical protein
MKSILAVLMCLMCLTLLNCHHKRHSKGEPQADSLRPASVQAIVLPESAFLEALNSNHFRVDRATAQRAVQLAAEANAPETLGISATVSGTSGRHEFSGSIFIVTRDVQNRQDQKQITSRNYYVVAVELSGRSPWVATSPVLMIDSALAQTASQLSTCCGAATICVPDSNPSDPCGSDGFCTGPLLGVTTTMPDQQKMRQAQGSPLIKVTVLDSGFGNNRAPLFSGSCTDLTLNRSCGIAKVHCQPGDNGFVEDSSGTANVDFGSICGRGSRPVQGREIPEWCTYVYLDSPSAPECQGARFETLSQSLTRVLSSVPISEDFLPPMCSRARVTEDSNVCTTARDQQQKKELENDKLRATFGFMGGRRCEPIGNNGDNSLSMCKECEPGLKGQCKQWMQRKSLVM